jgi:hypothetical protein
MLSRSCFSFSVTLAVATLAGVAALAAQDSISGSSDSTVTVQRGRPVINTITIERATVLAFGQDFADTAETTIEALRSVARRSGFEFRTTTGAGIVIAAKRFGTSYYVPRDVRTGFVLVVPGRPSDLVRGPITPDSLEQRLRMYLARVRPFSP